MVDTNNLKKGLVVKLDGVLYEVLEHEHYKPGKGQAFVRAKLRDLLKGSIVDKKLRSGEKIEDVFVDKKAMFFSYIDGAYHIFIDSNTYDQENIETSALGDSLSFLTENLEVLLRFYEGKFLDIELPAHVVLEVTYTEPGVRGDTATSATKSVTLETGLEIQAPLFVQIGDKLKVDTRTGKYVERA